MTIQHYRAEEYGVGMGQGQPIAESVDEYDDYPQTNGDIYDYAHKDALTEIYHAVEGRTQWVKKELGYHPIGLSKFVTKQGLDADKTDRLHVFLDGENTMTQSVWHIGQIGESGPLSNKRFLRACRDHDYSPADISALFDPLTTDEVETALIDHGLIEKTTVEIDGETVDLEDYHDEPHRDPRLLEKFDSGGYSIADVADTLGVSAKAVRKQVEAYNLTE